MNPKINNLYKPFEEAKYDILWVLDASISVSPSSLARSVEALISGQYMAGELEATERDGLKVDGEDGAYTRAGDVGVVHHVPFAFIPQKSFGSRLEQAYLNTTHAKMYLAIVSPARSVKSAGSSSRYGSPTERNRR